MMRDTADASRAPGDRNLTTREWPHGEWAAGIASGGQALVARLSYISADPRHGLRALSAQP